MFERYNEPARRSLFFARYEASVHGSLSLDTEHLLLGVLKEREPVLLHLLRQMNVNADAMQQLMYARIGPATSRVDTSVEIPFSKRAKQVLEYTAEEASRLLHPHVGTEHLLLGVLRLEEGLAWDVLRESGIGLAAFREALVIQRSTTSPPPPEVAEMLSALLPGAFDHARRHRTAVAYSMSVLDGPSPGRRAVADDVGVGSVAAFSTVGFSTPGDWAPDSRVHSIGPISMSGTTLPHFALVLEAFLGAPVLVDDDAMAGVFDIQLQGEYRDEDALMAALRDQLALELTKSLSS